MPEDKSVNETASGAVPEVGVEVLKLATGSGVVDTVDTLMNVTRVDTLYPPVLNACTATE